DDELEARVGLVGGEPLPGAERSARPARGRDLLRLDGGASGGDPERLPEPDLRVPAGDDAAGEEDGEAAADEHRAPPARVPELERRQREDEREPEREEFRGAVRRLPGLRDEAQGQDRDVANGGGSQDRDDDVAPVASPDERQAERERHQDDRDRGVAD